MLPLVISEMLLATTPVRTVRHVIDESSPLYGKAHADLIKENFCFFFTASSVDPKTGEMAYATATYLAAEDPARNSLYFGRFRDMFVLFAPEDGDLEQAARRRAMVIDYGVLDEVIPLDEDDQKEQVQAMTNFFKDSAKAASAEAQARRANSSD